MPVRTVPLLSRLNVVAELYRWSLTRSARRHDIRPTDLERSLGKARRGFRSRIMVLEAMVERIFEIGAITVVTALVGVGLAALLRDRQPAIASIVDYLWVAVALFPLGTSLGLLVWALVPGRDGGWYEHPVRLWPATVIVLVVTAALALAAVSSGV